MRSGKQNAKILILPASGFARRFGKFSFTAIFGVICIFALGENAKSENPCDPQFKKTAESFDEYCKKQSDSSSICKGKGGGSDLGSACTEAKEHDQKALDEVKAAYAQACTHFQSVTCTGAANNCQGKTKEASAELATAMAAAVAKLQERKKSLKASSDKLKKESQQAKATALDDAEGKECRGKGYLHPDANLSFHDGQDITAAGQAKIDEANRKLRENQEKIRRIAAGIEEDTPGARNPDGLAGLPHFQAETLSRIDNSISKIDQEINYFKRLEATAIRERDAAALRERGLGSPTPNNGSTITGNTDKNPSTGGSSPQAGSAPPSAAGAPPQSGGGSPPQNGGAPSGLTNQKDPNSGLAGNTTGDPNGTNPDGSSKPIGNDSKKADASSLPGDGIVNISQVRKNVFSPELKGVGLSGPRLADTSGANLKKDPRENLASGEKSSPASGKANGSGSSSSGGSTGDSGTGGKDKKDALAGKSGSEGETASNGGGGGPSGGGSEETLTPFGKPLGDPKFSLAGSETDLQIKKMMGNFDNGASGNGGRELASTDEEDGIGDKNGPDLFERCHGYLNQCQQKGCVSFHGGSKKGG